MKKLPIASFTVIAAMMTFATLADADPPPTTTITMTREELEKLIDARIAAKATPPSPTVGDGQKEVETPWAFGDFSWTPGGYAPSEHPLAFGPFTGEVRVDTVYHYEF
ncbi:MAG TPA: hypothetical protein VGH87_22255, partial [Polyangiaceae bacterium]